LIVGDLENLVLDDRDDIARRTRASNPVCRRAIPLIGRTDDATRNMSAGKQRPKEGNSRFAREVQSLHLLNLACGTPSKFFPADRHRHSYSIIRDPFGRVPCRHVG